MIALAKATGPGNVEFRVGDAQSLVEEDCSFDAVTMNFGLLHMSLPNMGIAEAYRVLRLSGRFAFSVWAEPAKSLGFSISLGALDKHADKALSLPPGPPFFHFSNRANSVSALHAAGFSNCVAEDLGLVWKLASNKDLFNAFLHGTARVGGFMRMQSPDTLARIKQTLANDAAGFQTATSLNVAMAAIVYVGTK